MLLSKNFQRRTPRDAKQQYSTGLTVRQRNRTSPVKDFIQNARHQMDLLRRDVEGGHEAQDVGARRVEQESPVKGLVHDFRRNRGIKNQRLKQTSTANAEQGIRAA